jgi:hypothetical protein
MLGGIGLVPQLAMRLGRDVPAVLRGLRQDHEKAVFVGGRYDPSTLRLAEHAPRVSAAVMNESRSLIHALRKLNEKNLSNLTPHPLYSGFYYSHPALLEREQALQKL